MKLKRMLSLAVIAGAFALLACKQDAQAAPADGQASGQQDVAPDFTLPRVNSSKVFQLSKQRGKVVLVDFWATWCPPCRMSIPHLIDLQKEHGGKNFTVVGVSLDQQSQVLPPFVTQWKMNYPVVNDSDGAVARAYGGIRSIPTGVLIDRHGKVITGFVGYHPKEEMEAMVEQALAKKD
jgi:thiol-disulfide isomerase/thioredoxin